MLADKALKYRFSSFGSSPVSAGYAAVVTTGAVALCAWASEGRSDKTRVQSAFPTNGEFLMTGDSTPKFAFQCLVRRITGNCKSIWTIRPFIRNHVKRPPV